MKCVAFIHPTLSIEFMFRQARQQGYKVLTIITTLETGKIDADFIHKNSDFVITGSHLPENDLNKVQQVIAENNLEIVTFINGIDSGIYYTDFMIKEVLHFPLNPAAAKIRLNKHLVNQKLEQNNITIIPGIELTSKKDFHDNMDWIKSIGFPLIMKPSENTAAMSAFSIIHKLEDIEIYIDKYLGKKNTYYSDKIIEKIILQKYICSEKFDEYALDFVSFNGKHYCRGIIDYTKTIEGVNYKVDRYCRPLTINELPKLAPVINYVADCLTALEVKYGLTHNEVFWDHNDLFYLIETNNRMAGNGILEIYDNAYGHNPLNDYFNLINQQPLDNHPVHRKNYSLTLDLYNKSVDSSEKLNVYDLESFEKVIHFRIKEKVPADFYKNYTRADHINASILLNHTSKEQLDRDVKVVLEREKNGSLFY